jgi:ubiquitin carboxyl-terminal hydrolase 4/11/15
VLLINLKRFRGNNAKQNTFVDFPVSGLDMSDYVVSETSDKPIYDLFAVSNHFG